MGSRRRLNKKTSWESTSLPVRNPLQPRPFGKGIQARRAELPTTNVLQTRPFGTPKQASTPKQEMPELQAKLKQAESFGYNAANIPTVPSSNATPIQAKLTIGEPNDKYEQEADQVADQVVNQINSPQSQQSVQGKTVQRQEMPEEEEELQAKPLAESIQRQEMPEEEEELQAKPLAESIQRQEMPEEEEELQAKPLAESIQRQEMPEEEEELQMKPLVQRQSSGGGMAATPELEESIQRAKGSGQPLSENIRQPMEQAFGADFSGVKVHTDTQSDQLNQSIQAKAFTTGENIFFKQGEYNPGSKGGQELLAHELTHVVQQGGASNVQRKQKSQGKDNVLSSSEKGKIQPQPKSARLGAIQKQAVQVSQQSPSGFLAKKGVMENIPGGVKNLENVAASTSVVITLLEQVAVRAAGKFGKDADFNANVAPQIDAAISSNLAETNIPINFIETRGMNVHWKGHIRFTIGKAMSLGQRIPSTTSAGYGGTATRSDQLTNSTTDSAKLTGGLKAGEANAGGEASVGGELATSNTRTTQTTNTTTSNRSGTTTTEGFLTIFQAPLYAEVYLAPEMEVSGSDYINPFKWGMYIGEAIDPLSREKSKVVCGSIKYSLSE
jgi:hypothetical protein